MRESCGQLHLRFDSAEVPYPSAYEEHPFRNARSAVEALFLRFASSIPGRLPLHAATIASTDGAVLIVGPRGIGKSLLALHLVHLGGRLMGDDLALLHPATRTVSALPRRPSLRESALRYAPTRELRELISIAPNAYRTDGGRLWYALRADDLAGIAPDPAELPIRAIVVITRRYAEKGCVARASTDDALSALLAHALAGWSTLGHISALRELLDHVTCFTLALGGPAESARLLSKALIART
jgi:hypothetical protein